MNELVTREYLGNNIEFKMIDGHIYANANKMAEAFGGSQRLKDWKRSENTKKYIEVLEAKWKFSTPVIDTKIGGVNGGESWIHEKLILNFARYLNVEFELWCDEQIATLLKEGKVETKPMTIQQMMIVTLQEQEKLASRVDIIETKVENEIRVDNGE
ncbi:KilA-N domain-containing protein [Fusobacterium varium]|uniref:KilA-N domain-containing protein n=1 Tax=Fusobacterium varium TaxID=856 RepID=UPI003564EC58